MSQFLFEKINSAKEVTGITKEIPEYIINGLAKEINLRDYQINALENFLIYIEGNLSKNKQIWNLFHMATGSGKTVIMAAIILYYYKQGYRNFLYFVRNINIIDKTIDNFTNASSDKYLFSSDLEIDGKRVRILKVENFQNDNSDSINICFSSNAGLQNTISLLPKENSLTLEDFSENKVVMLADESHHLNATTKNGGIIQDEESSSWEKSVISAFKANIENVLIEFTATCDLKNPFVESKYKDVIIFDYPLSKFREDKYSKEIISLPSTDNIMKRVLVSLILSEYRYKMFLKNNYDIKPIVMLKSKTIKESKAFFEQFTNFMENEISVKDLEEIKSESTHSKILVEAFSFFEKNNVSLRNLREEIRLDFSTEHCITLNSAKGDISQQDALLLNALEKPNNPYRLIFVVNMLNEGWDVLNLFDIVRLYNERQGAHGKSEKVSKYTISEAQLIGRGARYYPFQIEKWQVPNKRKYDEERENPYRLCETLVYHCTTDSKYIAEIKTALKEIGLVSTTEPLRIDLRLKKSFKNQKLYRTGYVFTNQRKVVSRNSVKELPAKFRSLPIEHTIHPSVSLEERLFGFEKHLQNKMVSEIIIVKQIAKNILFKGIRMFPLLKLNRLLEKFPNLGSSEEFITSPNYLGEMKIRINYPEGYELKNSDYLEAYNKLLNEIATNISKIKTSYVGTENFIKERIQEVIKDVTIFKEVSSWPNGGEGYSQNHTSVSDDYRLDLSDKEWYVYDDNYGTSEEKSFVKYFSTVIEEFYEKYEKVFLIRNEQSLGIYSFSSGDRFEPDYLLYLESKDNKNSKMFYQIFVEPKGNHLLQQDSWKEDFLEEISNKNIEYELFIDNSKYKIWGLPFYNKEFKIEIFDKYIKSHLLL